MNSESKKRLAELTKKQISLLQEYEQLLGTEGFEIEDFYNFPFPPFHRRQITFEKKCWLADNKNDFLNMMSAPGQRSEGLKEIKSFTKDAEKLIIIDPYIFSGKKEKAEAIAEDFSRSARLTSNKLKSIHFIYDGDKITKAVKKGITKISKQNSVRLSFGETGQIHDRIWIRDRKKGLAVGYSFNGIGGNKLSFLLNLPNDDLKELIRFLDENRLFQK